MVHSWSYVLDSAQAKAAAINLVSEESGVTSYSNYNNVLDLNFDIDATDTSFEVMVQL